MIMPDHINAVIQLGCNQTLASVMHVPLRVSQQDRLCTLRNETASVWQAEYYDPPIPRGRIIERDCTVLLPEPIFAKVWLYGRGIIRPAGVNLSWSSEMAGQDAPPRGPRQLKLRCDRVEVAVRSSRHIVAPRTVTPIEPGDVRNKQRRLNASFAPVLIPNHIGEKHNG